MCLIISSWLDSGKIFFGKNTTLVILYSPSTSLSEVQNVHLLIISDAKYSLFTKDKLLKWVEAPEAKRFGIIVRSWISERSVSPQHVPVPLLSPCMMPLNHTAWEMFRSPLPWVCGHPQFLLFGQVLSLLRTSFPASINNHFSLQEWG